MNNEREKSTKEIQSRNLLGLSASPISSPMLQFPSRAPWRSNTKTTQIVVKDEMQTRLKFSKPILRASCLLCFIEAEDDPLKFVVSPILIQNGILSCD